MSVPRRLFGPLRNHRVRPPIQENFRHNLLTGAEGAVPSAIGCARSSASISWIQTWSSLRD